MSATHSQQLSRVTLITPACVLTLLIAACGPASPESTADAGGADAGPVVYTNKVTGTVNGDALAAADAVTENSSTQGGIGIRIETSPNLCAKRTANTSAPGLTSLFMLLGKFSGETVTPGTYAVGATSGNAAMATFRREDLDCMPVSGHVSEATTGTITVATVPTAGSGSAQGTFDLTFGADHVTGTFNAPFCTGPTSSTTTCQ